MIMKFNFKNAVILKNRDALFKTDAYDNVLNRFIPRK